jgi:hypothetical protein
VHLSVKGKLFFSLAASVLFASLLLIFRAELFPKPCSNGGEFVEIGVQNLKSIAVSHPKTGESIFLHNSLSDKWICDFNGVKIPANQHAVAELLSLLKALKFSSKEYRNFGDINASWDLILTDSCGNFSMIKMAGANVFLGGENVVFFLENKDISKRLGKIYPELLCKNLLNGVEKISRFKFFTKLFTIDFMRVGNNFKMIAPLDRPVSGELVDAILGDISSLCCGSFAKATDLCTPLFALEFVSSKGSELVEFFEENSKFCARKTAVIYKFDGEAANAIGALHEKFINFHFFSAMECNSINLFSFPDNRQISLQKLENSTIWQKSYKSDDGTVFTAVAGEKIRLIEDKIASFSRPLPFEVNSHPPYVGKLSLQSNIGELNFDIFQNLEEFVFLSVESSLAFAVNKEFINILYSLLDGAP